MVAGGQWGGDVFQRSLGCLHAQHPLDQTGGDHEAGAQVVAERHLLTTLFDEPPEQDRPMMPPSPVPIAEKNAIAIARVSIGKISLTVG